MPKEFWPLAEARKILSARKPSPGETVVFETGYGPSGLPHLGTFAEVARTRFVIEALLHLAPEVRVKLIAFSDDRDGFRHVPSNVPNRKELEKHLGKPLNEVPDPFGEKSSYSEYMNGKLRDFLDSFDVDYAFKSSADCYRSGLFDEGLDRVFDRYDEVRAIFVKTISPEKRDAWSPFFMVCGNCGRINTTAVKGLDRQRRRVSYRCETDSENVRSCGYEAETGYGGGRSKVGWKVDWAMRWFVFDVAFEMHGEDLTDSAKVSREIAKTLCGKAPVNFKYELFLDESGRKISKKLGNGISMEEWLEFSPLAALMHFLLVNPNKPKKMGLPILPQIVDDFFQTLRTTPWDSPESPLWYVRKFSKVKFPSRPTPLTYTLLVNVCESLAVGEPSLLFEYCKKYDPSVVEDEDFFLDLCSRVIAYVERYRSLQPAETPVPDPALEPLRIELVETLETWEKDEAFDGDSLQTRIFSIAKEHGVAPRDWFAFLYAVMLKRKRGPKIGPLMAMLGKEKTLRLLRD